MDDPAAVRVVEREAGLEHDFDHPLHGHQLVGLAVLLERRAIHVLHHQVVLVFRRHGVVDGDDVRMRELAGERCLVQEQPLEPALERRVGDGFIPDHLDGDAAAEERIFSQVHAAGRTAPEHTEHLVLADLGGNVFVACHGGRGFASVKEWNRHPALHRGTRADRFEPALHGGEILQRNLVPFMPRDPRISRHIGYRIFIGKEVVFL